jgi:superfamily II DNA helicase RecQ
MNYFGENRDNFRCVVTNCGNCINQGFYISDGTNDALKVVQTIVELGNSKNTCNILKLILQGSCRKEVLSNYDCLSNFGSLQKKFAPIYLLDKFLHLLIRKDILGEEINLSHNSLKVGITLGSKAHSLLALDTTCIKYIKY